MDRKLSVFNVLVEIEGRPYLFNTRTHAVIEGDICRRLVERGADDLLEVQQARLGAKGILVPADLPEAEALHVYFMRRKFFTNYVLLTIAPTYRCNCACPDCPQLSYDRSAVMDEATQDGVARLLAHALQVRRPGRVAYWVSGGEPFACLETSVGVTRRIEEVCAGKAELKKSITTNGTLLHTSRARELIDHIDEFYVSLAESRAAQGAQRPFANQKNTYATVLQGLAKLAELDKKTTVRFNISSEEGAADELGRTISDIYEALGNQAYPRLFFQFHVLVPRSSCAEGWHITPGAVTDQLDRLMPSLRRLTGETPWPSQNFLPLADTGAHLAKAPPLIPGQELRICDYHKGDGFHVGPSGDIWACSMFAEQEPYWFGHVRDDYRIFENNRYLRFVNFDPFDDPRCRDCAYLPLCLRRCPMTTYQRSGDHRWSEEGCEAAVRARITAHLAQQSTGRGDTEP